MEGEERERGVEEEGVIMALFSWRYQANRVTLLWQILCNTLWRLGVFLLTVQLHSIFYFSFWVSILALNF